VPNDVRLDADGRANIVEVNPLPGILPDAADNSCLPKAARVAGIEYGAMVRRICELGLERSRGVTTTADRWVLAQRLSGMTTNDSELDLFAAGGA
jgi:hypothetical protein